MKNCIVLGTWAKSYNSMEGGRIYLLDQGDTMNILDVQETGRSISSLLWDEDHRLLFATCETNHHGEQLAAGGEIRVYRIDSDKLSLAGVFGSFGGFPIGMALFSQYLLVLNHGSNLSSVCITYRNESGEVVTDLVSDEASLCLFERDKDGFPGKIADQYIFRGRGILPVFQESPSPHELFRTEEGTIVIPVRGTDRIELFHIDEQNGKVLWAGSLQNPAKTGPRNAFAGSGVQKGKCYILSEIEPLLTVFDAEGQLCQKILTTPEGYVSQQSCTSFDYPHPSGLAVFEKRNKLYTITRSLNILTVFDILQDGTLKKNTTIPIPGSNPRQICVIDDSIYLVCLDSQNILQSRIDEKGIPGDFDQIVHGIENLAVMQWID